MTMFLKIPSNPNHQTILWFYNSKSAFPSPHPFLFFFPPLKHVYSKFLKLQREILTHYPFAFNTQNTNNCNSKYITFFSFFKDSRLWKLDFYLMLAKLFCQTNKSWDNLFQEDNQPTLEEFVLAEYLVSFN